jgi:hypothetical protein
MVKKADGEERIAAMLRKMTIIQLGLAGVGQREIRKIVGGQISDINGVVKLIRKRKEKPNGA